MTDQSQEKTILIVDDDETIYHLIAHVVQELGYRPLGASSAGEGLEIIERETVDLVVCDINLPGMNGLVCLEHLKGKGRDIPVIVITGDPTVENAVGALKAGAYDFIQKPVPVDLLNRQIVRGLENSRLRSELSQYQQDLEILVEKRTEELQESLEQKDLLYQKLIRNERLNALGQMSSVLVHDIKNHLTPISLYLEMLQSLVDDKGLRLIEKVSASVREVEQMADRIKMFAKGANDPEESAMIVHPQHIIDRTQDLCWVKIEAAQKQNGRNMRLEVVSQDELEHINVNETEIIEALVNLIFNAIEAMPEGGVVRLMTGMKGENVEFRVEDEGVGMDDNQLDHCLEPFFTTKGRRGTGLGLSSVYGIVKKNGGLLDIQSTLGVGTSISITIPKA